jgi:hypothetical protein
MMRLQLCLCLSMAIGTIVTGILPLPARVTALPAGDRLAQSPTKKAMTWRVLKTYNRDRKFYTLFGADNSTNPYEGDTETRELRSLLCIKKSKLPAPAGLPPATETPGGALRGTWSGGKVVIAPNVRGTELTSLEVANQKCNAQGMKIWKEEGFEMAEFHDGDRKAGLVGWDFWAEVSTKQRLDNTRYWVWIDDTPANPW